MTGRGDVVGAELVRNPDVAKISFTGSVGVGKTIMRDGAATMKRVTLELGGKSPNILLDDAVLEKAIPTALGIAFLNSGQACAAGTRLLVPKSRLDAVKRAIVDAMPAFPVGDPADPKTAVGPMVSQKQYERSAIIHPQRHRRRRGSARRRRGPSRRPRGGLLREAHGICQCDERHDDRPGRDFRPRPVCHRYDTEEDAIRIANDYEFGLHAAVIGTDVQRARRVASQLRAGRVVINGMT